VKELSDANILLTGEVGRRCQGAALEAAVHRESLLLRVQIQWAGVSSIGTDVVVRVLRLVDRREGISLRSGGKRSAGRLVDGAVIARMGGLRLLRGLVSTRLGELKLHLGHALGGQLELSLHVLHGCRVVAVGSGGAARRRRVGERVGALGGDVVNKRHTAVELVVLLFVEFGHEFAQDVVVLFTFEVGLVLLRGVSLVR
jgi:hypothetical protein